MLDEFLNDFLYNRKRYFRCIIAFILALLVVQYGFVKTVFIALVSFIGYISGTPDIKNILKRLYSDIEKR